MSRTRVRHPTPLGAECCLSPGMFPWPVMINTPTRGTCLPRWYQLRLHQMGRCQKTHPFQSKVRYRHSSTSVCAPSSVSPCPDFRSSTASTRVRARLVRCATLKKRKKKDVAKTICVTLSLALSRHVLGGHVVQHRACACRRGSHSHGKHVEPHEHDLCHALSNGIATGMAGMLTSRSLCGARSRPGSPRSWRGGSTRRTQDVEGTGPFGADSDDVSI